MIYESQHLADRRRVQNRWAPHHMNAAAASTTGPQRQYRQYMGFPMGIPHGESPWGFPMGTPHGESPWGFPMGNPHRNSPMGVVITTGFGYGYSQFVS